MPVPRPSSAPAASIAGVSQAFSSALLNIHDEQQENATDYDIILMIFSSHHLKASIVYVEKISN